MECPRPTFWLFAAIGLLVLIANCVTNPRAMSDDDHTNQNADVEADADGGPATSGGAQSAEGHATTKTASTQAQGDVSNVWVDFGDGAIFGAGSIGSLSIIGLVVLLTMHRRRSRALLRMAESIEVASRNGWPAEAVKTRIHNSGKTGRGPDDVELLINWFAKRAERVSGTDQGK